MKQYLSFLPLLLLVSFLTTTNLTKKEKKFAVNYLEDTRDDLSKAIEGLSEIQLNFKASAERWSIKECVQHIALTEMNLQQMFDAAVKLEANPEKRSEIKVTDEQLMKMMTDRSNKFQAPETFRPEKSMAATAGDALKSFKENRNKLIKFLKKTKTDLRTHVHTSPLGVMDSYQIVLAIAAHCNRHTQQITEVKADPAFPK